MFVPGEGGDEKEMVDCKSTLENLGESIQSLLGSKTDLTFTWADAVRLMVEDLSSDADSRLFHSSPPGQNIRISEAGKVLLEGDIVKLEGELDALKARLRQSDNTRREALNKLLDLKGSIRVFCRMRPFLVNEKRGRPGPTVAPQSDMVVIKAGGKTKEYIFDKVFLPEASQDDVFAEVEPILRSALDGHNVCIFAYGQTGTGKTYTMEGRPDIPGVVRRTIQELFRQAALDSTLTFTFTFSMLEVYMGCLRDLLVHRPTRTTDTSHNCLSIQMDAHGRVEVENLREVVVTDFSQAIQWYHIGSRARSTAWTNVNEASSRSHCLIRIVISCSVHEDRQTDTSKLWLVDLGGSERLLKTQASGQTMEEGKAINLSLSALGDVISALQRKQSHVPYRNSKLTQILRDSLGQDSKTLMLVHISPKEDDLAETVCSLKFATRARGIQLGRKLSYEAKEQRAAIMDTIMLHVRHLEDECQSARNNMETVFFLLREKTKLLAKSYPSSDNHGLLQPSVSQEEFAIDAESVDSHSLADRPLGLSLPRFMAPTASSRLRGRPQDTNCIAPGKETNREKGDGKRENLSTHVRTITTCSKPSAIAQSRNDRMQRQSSMPNNKKAIPFISEAKQCTIDESQCLSEGSMMIGDNHWLCTSMPNNRRVSAGSLSKQLCRIDKSQVSPGIATNTGIKQSSMPCNKRVSRSYSTKYTNDEQKPVPQGNINNGLRHSSTVNNRRVFRPHSKQLITDEVSGSVSDSCSPTSKASDQCFTESNLKNQVSPNKTTARNNHSRHTNSSALKAQQIEAENGHNTDSSKSPAYLSPKTPRNSFSDVSKFGATAETPVPQTQRKTSKGDLQSKTTIINKRRMSLEHRFSFSRKL